MTLTADEARELASEFRNLANEVGDHAWDNRSTLSEDDVNALEAKERRLRDSAADMVELAVDLDLAAAGTALAGLKAVTVRAKDTIRNIQQARRVIELATTTLQLAAAITTQNPAAISTSLGALSDKIDEIANA